MSSSIDNIYSEFITKNDHSADYAISFYERKSIFFNHNKQLTNKGEVGLYIELICRFTEAYYQKEHFTIAIDIVDKQQAFIDSEIERLNAGEIKDSLYHSIQFVKGMATYKLKDFKASFEIFESLTHYDSKNDNYRNWLNLSRFGQKMRLIRILNITFFGLVVIEIIFKSHIPNYYLRQTIVGVGLIGLISIWAYEYYLKRNQRKITSK